VIFTANEQYPSLFESLSRLNEYMISQASKDTGLVSGHLRLVFVIRSSTFLSRLLSPKAPLMLAIGPVGKIPPVPDTCRMKDLQPVLWARSTSCGINLFELRHSLLEISRRRTSSTTSPLTARLALPRILTLWLFYMALLRLRTDRPSWIR
jgi:hypothetical protein